MGARLADTGVRSRVSHPRLGIKTINIHPDVKQPFEVAVHSLDMTEVKSSYTEHLNTIAQAKLD